MVFIMNPLYYLTVYTYVSTVLQLAQHVSVLFVHVFFSFALKWKFQQLKPCDNFLGFVGRNDCFFAFFLLF